MVEHRKNVPPPQANVPSSWVIVLTVLVVIGGAGWLGWLLVDDDPATPGTSAASTSSGREASEAPATPSPDASPSPDATAEPSDEPSAEATDEPSTDEPSTDAPAADRSASVSVLNNSGIVGAARTFSVKVAESGWTLAGIGNWTGSIPSNTVYYPEGLQAQAELLARDVGIERVRPRVSPMRTDRLTIILSATP